MYKKIQGKAVGLLFILIGSVFLLTDFFLIKSTVSFLHGAEKTKGSVINLVTKKTSDNNITYAPEVSFTDKSSKEITFTSNSSSNPPAYTIGEKVSILYNKENSQDAKINTFFELWFLPIILSIFGLITFLTGFFIISKQRRNELLKTELLSRGTKISAKVISVEDTGIGENAIYIIVAQWLNPANNQMYVFKSERLSYNPKSFVTDKEIFVYIDTLDPQRYYVDLSDLPQEGN